MRISKPIQEWAKANSLFAVSSRPLYFKCNTVTKHTKLRRPTRERSQQLAMSSGLHSRFVNKAVGGLIELLWPPWPAPHARPDPLSNCPKNLSIKPSVVVNKLVEGKGNYGFYAQTGEYGDLVEMGVIACTLRRAEYLRSPRGRAPLREGRLILLIQ